MQIRTVTEEYIKDLLMKGQERTEGSPCHYREITIKTGVIPNAEGSAMVNFGNTKVLCGVKIGVGEPMPDKPDEGNLITGAELLPMASESYEIRAAIPRSHRAWKSHRQGNKGSKHDRCKEPRNRRRKGMGGIH